MHTKEVEELLTDEKTIQNKIYIVAVGGETAPNPKF